MISTVPQGGVVHTLPRDLKKLLQTDGKAFSAWNTLTPLARNEWICWIEIVKKEDTRKRRLVRLVDELKRGKRRPCCWQGCIHR